MYFLWVISYGVYVVPGKTDKMALIYFKDFNLISSIDF